MTKDCLYRPRGDVLVRAIRWMKRGDATPFAGRVWEFSDGTGDYYLIEAPSGRLRGEPGSWIVEMENGALRIYADELFHKVFEPHDPAPRFTLHARDPLAPDTVREWIARATISNVPESKIESAWRVVEAMERWPGPRHYPD